MKKAHKKQLERLKKEVRLTQEEATAIAERFMREHGGGGEFVPGGPAALSIHATPLTWTVRFDDAPSNGAVMDPSFSIVLVDDATGEASFFPVL
ncbi:hypothetical protein ACLESO_10740 [Pyxidicoccus sp. 3LG]